MSGKKQGECSSIFPLSNLDKKINKGLMVLMQLERVYVACLEKVAIVVILIKSDKGKEEDEVDFFESEGQ